MSTSIDWVDVIKKEARGLDDADFGEVQKVTDDYVLVQRGLINLERFNIPRDLADSYDGNVLRFRVYEEEALEKYRDYTDSSDEIPNNDYKEDKKFNDAYSNAQMDVGDNIGDSNAISQTIPLMEEKLEISKRIMETNASITKKPITESKTMEVSVGYEKIYIERRPPSENSQKSIADQQPVKSKKDIKIPLKREEIEVKKIPYVIEEVVIRKKPITETKRITQNIASERVNVSESPQ